MSITNNTVHPDSAPSQAPSPVASAAPAPAPAPTPAKRSLAARLEARLDSRTAKNWIKINQSSTLFSFAVAMLALALAAWKFTGDNQKADEDRVAKAWDVVTRMSGKQSNGGQVSALELLASSSTRLGKIDLHGTYLAKANVPHIDLQEADLQGVNLADANLAGANLSGANLRHANLRGANLDKATLDFADLSDIHLAGAKLSGASFAFATVDIAVIEASEAAGADFTGVKFVFVDQNDKEHWGDYADTLAESPAADDAQKLMDTTCSDGRFNTVPNKAVPFHQRVEPCKITRDYAHLGLPPGVTRSAAP